MEVRALFLVHFEALPQPESSRDSGAYINVWVDAPTAREATDIATREVSDAGWLVSEPDDVLSVTRDDYQDDAHGLEYFDQALVDGVVLVAHTWQEGSLH